MCLKISNLEEMFSTRKSANKTALKNLPLCDSMVGGTSFSAEINVSTKCVRNNLKSDHRCQEIEI